jgi:hypothetical protein
VEEIDTRAAAITGFSFIGNTFRGIGLPDCFAAQKAAEHIGPEEVA